MNRNRIVVVAVLLTPRPAGGAVGGRERPAAAGLDVTSLGGSFPG